jgi:CubicO group peptidase (beta-lactamase class C family)
MRIRIAALFFAISVFNHLNISLVSAQTEVDKIESIIQESFQKWDFPGMSVGIIYQGEVIYSDGIGALDHGSDQKPNGETLYAIASNTKAFIATAITMLVKEGKVSWKDRVQTYLPAFALKDPCATEMITIEDLLCHRAGLGTFSGDVIWYKNEAPAIDVIQKVKHISPAYDFRAGYGYSNLMFITAGEVIRAVTGLSWSQYIDKHIFEQLSMDRTVTSTDVLPALKNVATPHKVIEGESTPIPWVNWDNMGAAGGIISSTDDMLKWILLQLNHGATTDDTLFSRNDQIKMWTPHNSHIVSDRSSKIFKDRHFNGYGLGWGISDYAGKKIISHGGGYDGMYSRVVMVPESELGIVILTNGMKGISTPLSYQLIDHLLDLEVFDWDGQYLNWSKGSVEGRSKAIQKRKSDRLKDTKPSLALTKYTGTYHDPMFGNINVKEENQKLSLHFEQAPALNAQLSHWHLDVFKIEWNEVHAWFDFGTVQFMLDNNGHPSELRFDVPNDDIFFDEIKAVKAK